MSKFLIELIIETDDFPKWILPAIDDQLEDHEEIIKYRMKELSDQDFAIILEGQ